MNLSIRKMRDIAAAGFICLICAEPQSISAFAQQLPSSVEPGRIEKRFETPQMPRAVLEPLLPDGDDPLPPEEANKIRFELKEIKLIGNTVFGNIELSQFYQQHLGQQISLGTLYEISKAIASYYRNNGYVLSRAMPPAQRVENGIVAIEIVEGFIATVELEGTIAGDQKLIEAYAQKILASVPLNNEVLERYVLLINDLPGIRAKAVLIPSFETRGASDLILQIAEDRWDVTGTVDNRGTEFVGPGQVQLSGGLNNLLGQFERLSGQSIVTQDTDELKYFQLGYTQPIGTEGTTLSLSGNISWSSPGSTLKQFDVEGQNRALTLSASHPIIRSRRKNLSVRGTLNYKNSSTDLRDNLLSEDRIRAARIGVSGDVVDKLRGISLIDFELSQGLDILNASDSGNARRTRTSGRPDFTKLTMNLVRVQQIHGPFRAILGATGQYAFSQLYASEEFGIGGVPFGRAYDPSEYTGDHGIAYRIEGQYAVPYENSYLRSVQLYSFYDNGSVWRIDHTTREARASAASAGLGARFNVMNRVSGYIEVADPLTGSVATRGDHGRKPRFFFSLSATL